MNLRNANRPKPAEAPPPEKPSLPGGAERVSDSILKRVYWILGFFALAAAVILVQVVRIQVNESPTGPDNLVYAKPVLADRGSILADDGSVLAATLPFYRFALDATVLKDENFPNLNDSLLALSEALASHFGEENETAGHFLNLIQAARREQDRHIYLFKPARRFTLQDLNLMKTLPVLKQGRFISGFIAEKVNNQRFYPLGDLAKITLGRLENDTTGTRGIEFSFNRLLRGSDGKEMVQRVSGGLEVPVDYFQAIDPRNGYDIVTTLNVNLQDVAYNALKQTVEQHNAQRGVVILMETQTGHIKALVNYPEDFNLAVASNFEPGSTFKTASWMAAIEDGYISRIDSIATGNRAEMRYGNQTMRDEEAYGTITAQRALEKSSNIAVSKVMSAHYGQQPQRFLDRLDRMGALMPSGFQLRGEPSPYVIRPGTAHWNSVTLPWLSIGYNVRLTPLQMLTFYNAIANGGRMIAPVIVAEVRDGADRVQRYETHVLREEICSPRTLAQVRRMLEGVVEHGTAGNIHNPNMRIAGKTGTAKKLIDGRYETKYRASFVGYFPAENPQYACIVVIDEPQGSEFYGAKVAAPVCRQIADYIYTTRSQGDFRTLATARAQHLPSALATNQQDAVAFLGRYGISTPNRTEGEYVRAHARNGYVEFQRLSLRRGLMPDVRGFGSRNALALLENAGYRVVLRGQGKVVRQSVPPGRRAPNGMQVVLTLAPD